MTQALVVIDVQQGFDDPVWGPTANAPAAEQNVARLIAAWQAAGQAIVVVRHDSRGADSPLRPGQSCNDLEPEARVEDSPLFVAANLRAGGFARIVSTEQAIAELAG